MRVYTIKDQVAGESGPLFFAKNEKIAIRNFTSLMAKSPSKDDYTLYEIGQYDPETLKLTGHAPLNITGAVVPGDEVSAVMSNPEPQEY
jgi:hypothetical protein